MSQHIQPFLVERLKKIKASLVKEKNSAYLISDPLNLKYITGNLSINSFHREVFVLINAKEVLLIHSSLITQSKMVREMYSTKVLDREHSLSTYLSDLEGNKIYADFNDLSVAEFQTLTQKSDKELCAAPFLIEKQRIEKDDFERQQITKACQIVAKTWREVEPYIKKGKTENQIKNLIKKIVQKLGSDQLTEEFLPIVATGKNSAVPHHAPSNQKIKENDVVLVDFGCQKNGYWSDMTRTVCVGKSNDEFLKIRSIVDQAYSAGLKSAKHKDNNQLIDQKTHNVIKNHGFGDCMPHTTGHGLGLNIHELPSISRFASPHDLKDGTVFTIEPGIYLPGKFGVRYENTLIRQNDTVVELTK